MPKGTWLKNHPIPADKSRAGYNYELPDEIELQVRKMVEGVAANPQTPIEHKIGDAYGAWMDEAGIEARGTRAAEALPRAHRRGQEPQRAREADGAAELRSAGLCRHRRRPGRPDPLHGRAGQARLGLPTRDYYLLKDAKYDSIRKAYRQLYRRPAKLAGLSDPEGRADRIIALETGFAKDQWTPSSCATRSRPTIR